MLQNAHLLAKIGADTAENEQHLAEILPIGRRVADRPRRVDGGATLGPGGKHGAEAGPGRGPGRAARRAPAGGRLHGLLHGLRLWFFMLQILQCFLQIFANFWRARSRLYQNEILQENMRLTAFFKHYKICILLHRCNLKILAKTRFENSAIFVKFQHFFCKCCNLKICKSLPIF